MRRLLPALVLVLIGASSTAAAQPRPMTVDDLFTLRRLADPQVSPDGRSVVVVASEPDQTRNRTSRSLWLQAGDGAARRITRGPNDRSPRWSPDGSRLAYLSDRHERDQVFFVALPGGEPERLTDSPTPVSAFAWSPDGTTVAFSAVDPPSDERRERAQRGDDAYVVNRTFEWRRLWVLDVRTREVRRLATPDMDVREFAWAPDGRRLAVAMAPTTLFDLARESEVFSLPVDGGAPVRLTHNDALEQQLQWSPDGVAVYFVASDAERFVNAEAKLFRLDLATRAIARLARSFDYGLASPRVLDDGRHVVALCGIRVTRRLCRLDLAADRVVALSPDTGTVQGFSTTPDGSALGLVFTDASTPPALWRATTTPYAAQPAWQPNAHAAAWTLGETRTLEWTSRDGWTVEGLLTLPVGYAAGTRVPLVVTLHGGPEAAKTLAFDPDYMDYTQVLAGRGYAVLWPNYRGGTNYGDRFLQGMNGDAGGGDFHDIMTGVDAVIALGIADPERLGVMGWSWGGISTGWIVTQTRRFKAASAGAMVSNHFSVFGEADLTYDVEHFYVAGTPWADPMKYIRMSPIGHVMQAKTPTLLLHGLDDVRCPFPQSMEFYRGLRAAGVEAELVAYPREPHVFRELAHQRDKIERELAWFGRFLR
jgi:dipeptidyl aminopeptidase/acylaminoacyl peptidase